MNFCCALGVELAAFRDRGGGGVNNNVIGGGGRAGRRTFGLLCDILTTETCGRSRRPATLQQSVRWRRGQHVDERVPDTRPPGTGVRGPQNRRNAVLVRAQGGRTIHQRRATAVSSLPGRCPIRLRPDRSPIRSCCGCPVRPWTGRRPVWLQSCCGFPVWLRSCCGYPVQSWTGRGPVRPWTGRCPVRPWTGRRPVRLWSCCGCPVQSWTGHCSVRPRPNRQWIFSLTHQFLRTARNPLLVQTVIWVIHI